VQHCCEIVATSSPDAPARVIAKRRPEVALPLSGCFAICTRPFSSEQGAVYDYGRISMRFSSFIPAAHSPRHHHITFVLLCLGSALWPMSAHIFASSCAWRSS
jgi:hypothetical protein